MATASHNREAVQTIGRRLSGLRRQLSTWILVRGLGRWLLIVLSVLAVDMVLDRVFKMDYAQRAIMLVVMAVIAIVFLTRKLVQPLSKKIDDEKLLLEVEKKHADSGQSIISSYQLAQDDGLSDKGISSQLADATIEQGLSQAKKIRFGSALDNSQAQKNWLLLLASATVAGLLGVGIWLGTLQINKQLAAAEDGDNTVGTAAAVEPSEPNPLDQSTNFLGIWFNRNILLGEAQWPQGTYLEIVGAEDGEIVVARGNDHSQMVMVAQKSSVPIVDVSIEIDGSNGRTIHQMKPTGGEDGREHRFVFHNVSEALRFRAVGGDGETDWIQMVLVEPPLVEELTLQTTFPEYTGLQAFDLEGSGPHSLLAGTTVDVTISSNKSLQECSLKVDDNLLALNASNEDRTSFSTVLGVDHPLVGGKYDFVLKDERGLLNNRSASFTLKIKEDKRPKVRAEMVGISGLVVPRASIPTNFSVLDDFGLSKVEFNCNWKDSENSDEEVIRKIPIFVPADDEISVREEGQQVLKLETLNLRPDMSFRFAVGATDTNPQSPGFTKSRDFLVRVVTEEELRSDLLRREIEQRKAFQQAYDAQLAAVTELRAIAAMKQGDLATQEFEAVRTKKILTLYRNQKLIGTNVDGIANRFSDFLLEVQNNRLDEETVKINPEKTLQNRFGNQIIEPIRVLDQQYISLATQYLDNCRRTLSNQPDFNNSVEQTTQIQETILERMQDILSAMEDSEKFQDVVNRLLELKRLEERIGNELKNKDSAPDNIFDKEKKIFDDK